MAVGLFATFETVTVTYQADVNPQWPSLLMQALDVKGEKVSEHQWRFQVRREHRPLVSRLFGHLTYVKQVLPAPLSKPDLAPDHSYLPSAGPSGSPPSYWQQKLPQPNAVRVDFRPPVQRRATLFGTLFEARKVRTVNRHTFDYLPPPGLSPVEAAEAWRLSPWIRLAEPVLVP